MGRRSFDKNMDQVESQQKLATLKRHPLFPFAGMTTDPGQYALAELYWQYLFYSSVPDAQWRPWHAPDRTLEGNPIFSAINLGASRGVRVIQNINGSGPSEEGPFFAFLPFLSYTPAEPHDPNLTILELCFVADISESTEARCVRFWQRFCIERASEDEIEQDVKAYEDEVGLPEP